MSVQKKPFTFKELNKGKPKKDKEKVKVDDVFDVTINADDNVCPICFEEYEDDSLIQETLCLHMFHHECLKEWIIRKIKNK